MALFPHSIGNLLAGPIRVLYAPVSVAKPVDIADIIDMEDPYDPATGWIDVGATTDATEQSFDMESEGYEIQQTTNVVAEKITTTTRQITVPIAEFRPPLIKLIEESSQQVAITAAAGASAQTAVDVGSIDSLTRYRFAWVAMRDKGFGSLVSESGTPVVERGTFVAFAAYQASIAAEEQSFEIDRADLASREVTFSLFPDSTISDPRLATGRWLFETPGTIT